MVRSYRRPVNSSCSERRATALRTPRSCEAVRSQLVALSRHWMARRSLVESAIRVGSCNDLTSSGPHMASKAAATSGLHEWANTSTSTFAFASSRLSRKAACVRSMSATDALSEDPICEERPELLNLPKKTSAIVAFARSCTPCLSTRPERKPHAALAAPASAVVGGACGARRGARLTAASSTPASAEHAWCHMQSECVGDTVMKRHRAQRAQRRRQPRTAAGHELASEAASVHTPWLPVLHIDSGRLRPILLAAAGVIEVHSWPRPTPGPPPV
mmetsp:Transcript_22322/g.53470  ORF Transcript_22322/g.53470 Transcript_22322/m.53470 type:complete len:274 (+) Transcript_22322:710-1531(+)